MHDIVDNYIWLKVNHFMVALNFLYKNPDSRDPLVFKASEMFKNADILHILSVYYMTVLPIFNEMLNYENNVEKIRPIKDSLTELQESVKIFIDCHDHANTCLLKISAQKTVDILKLNMDTVVARLVNVETKKGINNLLSDTRSLIIRLEKLEETYKSGHYIPGNVLAKISSSFANYAIDMVNADAKLQSYNIYKLNHIKTPIIAIAGGFCAGIGMEVARELLITGNDQNLTTIEAIKKGTNLSRIAFSQRLVETRTNHKNLHTFANENTIASTSWSAAQRIAREVCNIFTNIKAVENYALELGLFSCEDDGHSVAFVHKNDNFYFVDANSGVYKFKKLEELENFTSLYLSTIRYSQLFSNYSITNYPDIEEKFPVPCSIEDKIVSSGIVEESLELPPVVGVAMDALFKIKTATDIIGNIAITKIRAKL